MHIPSQSIAAIVAADPAPSIVQQAAAAAPSSATLERVFAEERAFAHALEQLGDGKPKHRPQFGRGDVAEKRAADRRRKMAKKAARRIKRDRS